MRMKKFLQCFLIALFVIGFLLLIAGGWTYYSFEYSGHFQACIAMTLQNCFETLLFSPILLVEDIVGKQEFWGSLNQLENFFMRGCCIAMVVIPFVNILFVFSILDSFLHFFVGGPSFKKKVLIVGYNEQVKNILDLGTRKYKVYLWAETALSKEEERNLFLQGIVVKTKGFSLGDSEKNCKKQMRRFNRFLRNKRISNVVLLDEADARNMQYYMVLSHCNVCKRKTIHFFALINSFENRNALQDYFDKMLEEDYKETNVKSGKKEVPKGVNTHMDLRIFNFAQLQAERLLGRCPLYEGQKEDKSIHVLIIGGGQVGEHVLLHAMNQGVLSSNNHIVIDVIDKETEVLRKKLCERFSGDYVYHIASKNEFHINSEKADGSLKIRLTQVDIYADEFCDKIRELQYDCEAGNYSYIAICIPDIDANLHCALEIKRANLQGIEGVSMALRMPYSDQMKVYFEQFEYCPKVCLMGARGEDITLGHILNSVEEKKIRDYNVTYDMVGDFKLFGVAPVRITKKSREVAWNRLDYYQRESNRALYCHRLVKQNVFTGYENEMQEFWESIKCDACDNVPLVTSEYLLGERDHTKTFEKLKQIAKTEHRRFCYFYASEGWGYSEDKNPTKRVHGCLCNWNTLIQKKKEMLIYDLIAMPELMEEIKKISRHK